MSTFEFSTLLWLALVIRSDQYAHAKGISDERAAGYRLVAWAGIMLARYLLG